MEWLRIKMTEENDEIGGVGFIYMYLVYGGMVGGLVELMCVFFVPKLVPFFVSEKWFVVGVYNLDEFII